MDGLVRAQAEDAALRLRLHRQVSAPTSIRTVLAEKTFQGWRNQDNRQAWAQDVISMRLVTHHEICI